MKPKRKKRKRARGKARTRKPKARKPSKRRKRKGGKTRRAPVPVGVKTNAQRAAVVRAYRRGGTTYEKLAKANKTSIGTIRGIIHRAGSNKKRRNEIRQKAVKKAVALAVDRNAERIAEMNEKLVNTGLNLAKLSMAEIVEEAKRIKKGRGDGAQLRALAGAYKDIVQTLRLQTGQTTAHNANSGQMNANVVIETWDQRVRRKMEERGLQDFRVVDAQLPGTTKTKTKGEEASK